MNTRERDILIELRTDVKYIRRFVATNKKSVIYLKKQNQKRKDWQEDFDSKIKVFLTIATTIGGVIVFIGNMAWNFFMNKRG